MRQRLLDATVECLVERGWSGTSTTLVSQRAGVSRGAQLHHFPTKSATSCWPPSSTSSDVAAAELRARRGRAARPGRRRTRAVLEMLADALHRPGVRRRPRALGRGPHRPRACARRSAPLEQRIGRETHRSTVELLGVDESEPGVRELVQATLDLVRGLGLATTAHRRRRPPQRGSSTSGPRSSTPRSRSRGSRGRPARGGARRPARPRATSSRPRRAALDERRAGAPPPRPPAGTSRTRSRTWPGPTRPPCSPRPTRPAWDAMRAARRSRTPTASSTTRRPAGRRAPPAQLLARWRTVRGRLAEALAAAARGHQAPVVRPADERHLDGHRPVHGDLGARPRRRRRARRRAARRRPGPARRAPRRADPRLRLRQPRARRRPTSDVPGRPDAAGRRPSSSTARPTPTQSVTGSALRLRPAGHPAACTATTPTWSRSAPTRTPWLDVAQAFAGPTGDGRAPAAEPTPGRAAGRQLQRLLRRPALRDARDARPAATSTCSPATTSPS